MENLNQQIIKLREERRAIMKFVEKNTLEIEHMLNVFSLDEGETLVSWDDLRSANLGESYPVNDKVNFIKYYQDNNTIKFKTYIKAGGSFGFQDHDCLEETKVLSGHLIEATRGNKVYGIDQIITYKPMELHKPYANIDSVLDVLFTKKP